jgi:hypothetical protein
MLNGRETLKKEIQMGSYVPSGLGMYNRSHPGNSFNVPEGEGDVVKQSIWTGTTKRGDSSDTMGTRQIQIDRKVVVSNM